MRRFPIICAVLGLSGAALFMLTAMRSPEVTHYTASDLIDLSCEELGEKHEEVIFAYHDAEIAYYKREGEFHQDLGLPKETVLPYVILMSHYIDENDLSEVDLSKLVLPSQPMTRSRFFSEVSSICASQPDMGAMDAVRQAATKLHSE